MIVVVVLHGLLHLLGAAKGLGWARVTALSEPISTAMGWAWLVGALLVVAAGAQFAGPPRSWWLIGALAAIVSQALIFTSWADAKAGTIVNALLLAAAVEQHAARGPRSLRSAYERQVAAALVGPTALAPVTELDLAELPSPVAEYVRRSGAVGQPRVRDFRARIHGRIRSGVDKPWMSFVGEQVNTYGTRSTRLFFMDATLFGLPVDVLHTFLDRSATMRVRLCSLVTMVDASGPELDRAETVTLFNDLFVLAPAALVDAAVTWQPIDEQHTRGSFTRGDHTVSAELVFDDDGDLIDFISDDRLKLSQNGKHFDARRWSTPLRHYRSLNGRRVAIVGEGRWHALGADGDFAYLEFVVEDITYNSGAVAQGDTLASRLP